MPGTVVAIDGEWYDFAKFAKVHPGGKKILEHFDGEDGTDAFFALHSDKAVKQLKNMKPIESKRPIPEPTKIDKSFRQFRDKLKADGWWDREPLMEALLLIPILAAIVWGTVYSYTYPVCSMLAIGVAMTQAGWLGHDLTHARNSSYTKAIEKVISGTINGFDAMWWSRKHNTHHVFTNHIGIDPDIDMMPILFLMAPTKAMDTHLRKYQEYYAVPAYASLFLLWRWQSFWYAWDMNDKKSLMYMLPGYIWLMCLPMLVSFGSIVIGGFFAGMVVVQSHENEEMTDAEHKKTFIVAQFDGTADIECSDPVTEYMFGGMQYQLTHHLFPSLPRYKYARLQPIVIQWAKDNGLVYKKDGVIATCRKHFAMLRRNANVATDESCRPGGWSVEQIY